MTTIRQEYDKNLFATRNIPKEKALAKISRMEIKVGLQNAIVHLLRCAFLC